MNQGNKAIAHHARGQRACLAALEHTVLQTEDQRVRCGAPNMVPVYRHGDPKKAAYCIDVFEFPNKPCELPFVWAPPTHAKTMCEIQGKRLCTEDEWSLACRADPNGGPDTLYAYGNDLDLDVCNTNKPRPAPIKCSPESAEKTWETCETNTEPTGSFPKCRSRFGVYDMHGNVAEIMTRKDADGNVVSQLKGSAFFYAEVARRPDEPQKPGGRETYPDHCNFDPRWHVEPIQSAWHVNYHLGFRCCKSIAPIP
jgi:formylglycine-generating enzyme required for sulfatase activity